MKKSQRRRINTLARKARAVHVKQSAPSRKIQSLEIEVAKLTTLKIEYNRLMTTERGNEAIKAFQDYSVVWNNKALDFNARSK